MSGITKEELVAYTEAQNKTAVALEKIVDRLSDMALKQDKIIDKMAGCVDGVVGIGKSGCGNASILKDIKEAVQFMKIFWGVLVGVTFIAFIFVEAIHKFGIVK